MIELAFILSGNSFKFFCSSDHTFLTNVVISEDLTCSLITGFNPLKAIYLILFIVLPLYFISEYSLCEMASNKCVLPLPFLPVKTTNGGSSNWIGDDIDLYCFLMLTSIRVFLF